MRLCVCSGRSVARGRVVSLQCLPTKSEKSSLHPTPSADVILSMNDDVTLLHSSTEMRLGKALAAFNTMILWRHSTDIPCVPPVTRLVMMLTQCHLSVAYWCNFLLKYVIIASQLERRRSSELYWNYCFVCKVLRR